MKNSLINLITKDLKKLQKEINEYASEDDLWMVAKDIKNSGGNLTIHLIGNLNHFIGAILGNSGYIRVRDKEFNLKNISRKKMLSEIDALIIGLEEVFLSLNKDDLAKVYPLNVFGKEMTTAYFLLHLYGHLNYHLGQINYHRRLINN